MKHSRVLTTITLGLGLTLALLWVLRGSSGLALAETARAPTCPGGQCQMLAGSDLASTPASLTRQHDPVVITGSLLSNLTGTPLDEIFVYVYQDTALTQIPFQIDERDADGIYVAVEDGQLDDNDELVIMAIDAGGWVDYPSLYEGSTLITPTYVITLTDPISDTHAWAYVFRSGDLTYSTTADYVSYDGDNDRITSQGWYAMGFNATYAFRDYLSLGDSSLDLLDRDKLRITGTVTIPPYPPYSISADERDVTKAGVHAIDGPVRVTRVSTSTFTVRSESTQITTTLFAYRSLVAQPTPIIIHGDPIQIAHHRTSTDWDEQASGMVYYDANNPAGVIIDGVSDIVTITPPTRWTQIASITGTVVSVSEIPAGPGGIQSTYYKDSSAVESDDTGDQLSYGDAGLRIDDPTNPGTYTELGHIYFLTGTTTNVGATYVDYYDNPLRMNVGVFTPAPAWVSVAALKDVASAYPGETATYVLSLTAIEGFHAPVTLSLQGAPAGATVTFDPNPVTPPGTSQLHITTAASTAPGTYAMTAIGTSGVLTDAANLTLALMQYTLYLPCVTKNY